MKTITFYSEKGGVGKSTFSIMYASWLQKHGVKVGLADFNDRINRYRRAEIEKREEARKKNPDIPPYDLSKAWPISSVRVKEINELKKNGSNKPYATWLVNQLEGPLSGLDVLMCDFPGNMSGGEFVEVVGFHLLNLFVIPTERDEMTLQATLKIHKLIENLNHCIFINKAQLGLRGVRKNYMLFAEKLMKIGFPLLPDMVAYSERIMDIEKIDSIRSTFGFPDFSLPEYGNARDLGIENLFIDVTRELVKTPDLKGTGRANLDFINGLTKTQDGRQLTGTAYPQYELKP